MARKNSKDAGHRAGVITARAQSYTGRIVAARDEIQRFLIVCEGEQTEPNYFRSFRVPKEVVDVHGVGDNTKSLVEKAITLRDAAKETDNPYDQVWCVFDRDSFPAKHVNEALRLAISAGIHTALSNEAFEIWYLLHFDYHDVGISRQAYNDKLNRLLKQPYQKNSRTIYDETLQQTGQRDT